MNSNNIISNSNKPESLRTITSLELVKQINFFRNQIEGKAEILHKNLLEIIRDEFEEEISTLKIQPTHYNQANGGMSPIKRPMFTLTLTQAKQVLIRESKLVRKAVIKYIEELENSSRIAQTQKPLTLLELLDLTRQSELARIKAEEQLTQANLELNHKQEIILDLTADIPPKEMRKTINEVIRWKRGDYGARWNKLYKQFKYHFSVDIPTRAKHREMAKLDYAQKENLLTKLYKLSLELFEKDNPELNQLQLT
jgi:hypothetical protein